MICLVGEDSITFWIKVTQSNFLAFRIYSSVWRFQLIEIRFRGDLHLKDWCRMRQCLSFSCRVRVSNLVSLFNAGNRYLSVLSFGAIC